MKQSATDRTEPGIAVISAYERSRDLPGLIGLWPGEVERLGPADQQRIVRRLMRALRSERVRGSGGHWTYDLSRHRRLLEAIRIECGKLPHGGFTPVKVRNHAELGRAERQRRARQTMETRVTKAKENSSKNYTDSGRKIV